MSSVFMSDMQRNLEEDAALTVQRPRQSLQEDRSPDDDVMMSVEDGDQFQQTDEIDFMFDGLLEALKRRLM